MQPPLILASASPRRHDYLTVLGLDFTVHTADIDETPLPDENPAAMVARLSQRKAEAVAVHYARGLILAADTTVVLNDENLGKPESPAEAFSMLEALRTRAHWVLSAIYLLDVASGRRYADMSRTRVQMRAYTNLEIEAYIATGDPMDKAGAYAIQHPVFAPVAHLEGCYAGVVGLPLGVLAAGLRRFGMMVPPVAAHCAAHTGQPCCMADA